MIYLDTSAALAHILADDRAPSPLLWDEALVSSRLLEYELWNRVHGRGLAASHAEAVRSLLHRVALLELAPPVLARAIEPFPIPVRTLDAIHLASLEFLRGQRVAIALASYDTRMLEAANRLGMPVFPL